jgi:phage terminase large subunit-like protein
MQALAEEGLPIVEYPTTSAGRMVAACSRLSDALAAGAVTHTGDPDLARHVAACSVKEDRLGRRIVKASRSSKRRIDLAVCAVAAHDRAASVVPRREFHVF